MSEKIIIEDVQSDLVRIQEFDPESLIQKSRLGEDYSFESAVEPAKKLISLFRKLPKDAIPEFPHQQLSEIQGLCKSAYNLLDQIIKFDPRSPDAVNQHQSLVDSLRQAYQRNFGQLFPYISYGVARTVDFNRLSEEGRAAVQGVRDETESILEHLQETSSSAERILQEVRDAAAEHGVTQQARYFAAEAQEHDKLSNQWMKATFIMASAVAVYAVVTLFFPLVPFLVPENAYQAAQLVASKFLVFFVLAYVLILCAKNFNSHKHNSIVNKHRQNALMTYTTLADAGSTPEARDAVLQHAAAAIYAPNDSGYIRHEERGYGGNPVVGFTARPPFSGHPAIDGQ